MTPEQNEVAQILGRETGFVASLTGPGLIVMGYGASAKEALNDLNKNHNYAINAQRNIR